MSRKKSHEEKPADPQPETIETTGAAAERPDGNDTAGGPVLAVSGQPDAENHAEAGTAEQRQALGADGATLENADAGEAGAAAAGDGAVGDSDDVGQDPARGDIAAGSDGNDGTAAAEGDGGEVGSDQEPHAGRDDVRHDGNVATEPAATIDDGNGGVDAAAGGIAAAEHADQPPLDPDGNPPSDAVPPGDNGEPSPLGVYEQLDVYEQYANDNPNFHPAVTAMELAMMRAFVIAYPAHRDACMWETVHLYPDELDIDGEALVNAAKLINAIGDRATTAVIGQELFLKGHRKSGTLSGVLEVAMGVFQHTLLTLNAFSRAEADRLAAEEAARSKPEVKPERIEDTTLEPTDGPFDTVY